jgi:transposase-like protein
MDRAGVGFVPEMKDAAETEGARRATGVLADAVEAPDPEVVAKPKRRRFSAEYRLKILKQADACKAPGELGALLRREGLYSSLLSTWRRQREQGELAALQARKRGPKPKAVDPRVKELEKQNARLQRKLKQAEMIIEVQKKVHEILGIPLRSLADEGDD